MSAILGRPPTPLEDEAPSSPPQQLDVLGTENAVPGPESAAAEAQLGEAASKLLGRLGLLLELSPVDPLEEESEASL